MTIQIKSTPLFVQASKPTRKTDPPEGCAIAQPNTGQGNWPDVAVGEEIQIQTTDHWIWLATLEEVRDSNHWIVRIVGEKQPMPLPPIVEGEAYRLPYEYGDAWSTRPEKGKVLTIDGQHFRVTQKPRPCGPAYEYDLAPVTAEAHGTRPGRVAIKDLIHDSPDSHRYYGHNVGRVMKIADEWLHIERVERIPYGDAEGLEVFGVNTFGVGHFVPAAGAERLKAQWDGKQKVRDIELHLRIARQDIDYGGNPDAVPALEAALAEARKAAGIK